MKNFNFFTLLFFVVAVSFAQQQTDSLNHYLEDQLYITAYKINLINTPVDYESKGFSNGISFGFIKDIPLNEKKNLGVGLGIGLAVNSFKNNIKLIENNGVVEVFILKDDFITNKITTQAIEFPIELRWRTSTLEKFKFWRIYSGAKIAYLYQIKYVYADSSLNYILNKPENLNKLQYGFNINAGYGSFNFYFYYGLKPLYKSITINQDKIDIKEIKFGLIIYIL